jgi:hypothetical protein
VRGSGAMSLDRLLYISLNSFRRFGNDLANFGTK